MLLAVFFAVLLVSTQAVQMEVISAYNGFKCDGAFNASFITDVSGACATFSPTESTQKTCGVTKVFEKSATCGGSFRVNNLTQCIFSGVRPLAYRSECKDYAAIVAVSFLPACGKKISSVLYLPVGDCVLAFTTHPANFLFNSSAPQQSFKVVSSAENQFVFTSFPNANCEGKGDVALNATTDACVAADVSSIDNKAAAVKFAFYQTSSAQNIASSVFLLMLMALF